MLVSCAICGKMHDRKELCKRKDNRKKDNHTSASKFRSQRVWSNKAKEIKQRDKYLCQYCWIKKDRVYTFHKLEVHHIIPIIKAWDKRLDNYNLITLCKYCHYRADKGEIKPDLLLFLAKHNETITPGSFTYETLFPLFPDSFEG